MLVPVSEESCACFTDQELCQELAELQQLAGRLEMENKKLVETVHDGENIYHCTTSYDLTRKTAELEDLFKMLQTKKDNIIARMLNMQKSCRSSTCRELLKKVAEFENHVQRLNMDNRNLLATQQEYYNHSTCLKLLQRVAVYENQTETLTTIKDNLLVALDNLQETEESLRNEAQRLQVMNCELETKNVHQQKEISRWRTKFFTLKYQLDDAKEVIQDGAKKTQELIRVKSQLDKERAVVVKLNNALQNRKVQEATLNRQNSTIKAELARLESQRDEQYKEKEKQKTIERNLLGQLDEADFVIRNKDELITTQSREIVDSQKTIEEQHLLTEDLRKSFRDVKDQVEEAQLELIRKQTRYNDHNLKEELKISTRRKKVQRNWWFLKLFFLIIIVFVSFIIFGSVLTTGLEINNCDFACEFLQPISKDYPIPL